MCVIPAVGRADTGIPCLADGSVCSLGPNHSVAIRAVHKRGEFAALTYSSAWATEVLGSLINA